MTKFRAEFAILIPYRDRWENLIRLIPHLEWFLKDASYDIYVLEQTGRGLFNKGKILNAGFSLLEKKYNYFIFHDVDLIPLVADYSFPKTAVHLSRFSSQFGYKILIPKCLYGVTLFSAKDFRRINGFSNLYEGWGVEDEDLYFRCTANQLKIENRPGRFLSLPHSHAPTVIKTRRKNIIRFQGFGKTFYDVEGLNTNKFKLTSSKKIKAFSLLVPGFVHQMSLNKPVHWLRFKI